MMDIYRFFERPPSIVLATRTRDISADSRLSVQSEVIPIPAKGLETAGLVNVLSAILHGILYLTYSVVLCVRLRPRRNRIGLVHAHYIFPQGLFGLVLARLLGVPLIVSAVGQDVNETISGNVGQDVNAATRRSVVLRSVSRFVMNRAFCTIAVSRPIHVALRKFNIRKIVYLPNSVDVNWASSVSKLEPSNTVLFVASMTDRKRPMLLLDAFGKVLEKVPTALLIMVGDGPLRDLVEQEAKRKGINDRVKLFRHVTSGCLGKLLSEATAFALPSLCEGLSFALLEAMAAGKVIVASRNESHSAVLQHGKNALLFEVDNLEDLTKQILVALTDRRVGSRLGASARRLCESQFSNKAIALQLEHLYLQIAARSRGKKIQPSPGMATLSVVNGPRTDLTEA